MTDPTLILAIDQARAARAGVGPKLVVQSFLDVVTDTCAYRELNPETLVMKSAKDRLSSEGTDATPPGATAEQVALGG